MQAVRSAPLRRATAPIRLLVADERPEIVEALRVLLKREGFVVRGVSSPPKVLEALSVAEHDVALVDVECALVERMREIDPTLPVVVMTSWGSTEGAADAVRRGARDYVVKPWDAARLVATLRREADFAAMLRRSRRLESGASRERTGRLPELVARAPAMQPVLRLLERVADSEAGVLVIGEQGTGKEVVARWIHQASARAGGPFVAVDVAGLSPRVIESELFGHTRGAFTDADADRMGCFELADGGTLFIDGVAELPLAQQAKLLRVLETGEVHPIGASRVRTVDARVVAAANADVKVEDLVEMRLPPLRERREDIAPLAEHFLSRMARRPGKGFSDGAIVALEAYAWPGNVRELEHVVARAILVARGRTIEADDLGLAPAARTLEEVELRAIEGALARAGGSVRDAALALGLSRRALHRRLRRHGLRG